MAIVGTLGQFNSGKDPLTNPDDLIKNSDYVANLTRLDNLFKKCTPYIRVTSAYNGGTSITVDEAMFFQSGQKISILVPAGTVYNTTVNANPISSTSLPIDDISAINIPIGSMITLTSPDLIATLAAYGTLGGKLQSLTTQVNNLQSNSTAFATHVADLNNPHNTTKAQVGLANVENTALSTWVGSGSITTIGTLTSGSVPVTRVTGLPTFPTSNIVGTADVQTLTNKTINGSQNTITNINLSTSVTGILPVSLGGTGVNNTNASSLLGSVTANNVQSIQLSSSFSVFGGTLTPVVGDGLTTGISGISVLAGNGLGFDGGVLVNTASPVGEIKYFAGASTPVGYLLCAGQAVSRITYAALFAVIGTIYGVGNGSTTFNVPDLRGRVALGLDNLGGTNANRITTSSTGGVNASTLGGVGGAQAHTLTIPEMPAHSHSLGFNIANIAQSTGSSIGMTNGTPVTSASVGGGGAHSNTQPWLALSVIIKY